MRFLNPDFLLPRVVGVLAWACCLILFPTIWALITLVLGAFQVLRCEKINSTVNELFRRRTNNNSLGYIESDGE
jgi:diacylglycerol kinase